MKISKIMFLMVLALKTSILLTMTPSNTEDAKTKSEYVKPKNLIDITPTTDTNLELTKMKNLGNKPIIISIHGVGEEKAGRLLYDIPDEDHIKARIETHDLIDFRWHQGKYTKGLRDKDIIEGAKRLANLILDILRDIRSREIRESKTIKLKLILIAHSMGGNVLKVALNLLDHQYKKIKQPETTNIIHKIKNTIMGIVRQKQTYQSPAEYDFVDTRYNENKKLTKTIKDKFTRKYYEDVNNEIGNRMMLMSKAGSIPKFPFIEACYTLGTPNRKDFPFNEDMDVTKAFYCLFSYGDKVQKNAGLTRIPKGENKFNIRVKIVKDGKEVDPKHNQLIRGTSIFHKILDVNEKNIEKNLNQYLEKLKKEKTEQTKTDTIIEAFQSDPLKAVGFSLDDDEDEEKLKKEYEKEKTEKIQKKQKETQEKLPKEIEDIKKSIQTIEIIFPESKDEKLKWNFSTKKPLKEKFIPKKLGAAQLKI